MYAVFPSRLKTRLVRASPTGIGVGDDFPATLVWASSGPGRISTAKANTEATIEQLNSHSGHIHKSLSREYAVANYHSAEKLAALIGDYIDYGEASEKLEERSQKIKALED